MMIGAIMRQLLAFVFTLWLAFTVTFIVLRVMPGNAIEAELIQSGASQAAILERQQRIGLSDPWLIQYAAYLTRLLLYGDMGTSLLTGEAVVVMIGRGLGHTLILGGGALIIAVIVGISLGLAAAHAPSRRPSRFAQMIVDLSMAVPIFWTATLAILIFAVMLQWLPSGGTGTWTHLVMPLIVLGFHISGSIARIVAVQVSDIFFADFVRTAWAKGLNPAAIMLRHVLRPAAPALIRVIALQAGFLFSGTVVIETIFLRPGLGRVLLDAVIRQDYPVVQGAVLTATAIYALCSLLAEFFVRMADPRMKG